VILGPPGMGPRRLAKPTIGQRRPCRREWRDGGRDLVDTCRLEWGDGGPVPWFGFVPVVWSGNSDLVV
jgi:hypothetical protein